MVPPRSSHFPYTTLFRSRLVCAPAAGVARGRRRPGVPRLPPARARHRAAARPGLRAPWEGEVLPRSEEHMSELQSLTNLVCRLLLEKIKPITKIINNNNK